MRSNTGVETRDEVSAELISMLARLGELADEAAGASVVPDAVRIDRLALMEKLRGALVALGRRPPSRSAARTRPIGPATPSADGRRARTAGSPSDRRPTR